jgi:hypothetical protein
MRLLPDMAGTNNVPVELHSSVGHGADMPPRESIGRLSAHRPAQRIMYDDSQAEPNMQQYHGARKNDQGEFGGGAP